jgi:hypothetical protein
LDSPCQTTLRKSSAVVSRLPICDNGIPCQTTPRNPTGRGPGASCFARGLLTGLSVIDKSGVQCLLLSRSPYLTVPRDRREQIWSARSTASSGRMKRQLSTIIVPKICRSLHRQHLSDAEIGDARSSYAPFGTPVPNGTAGSRREILAPKVDWRVALMKYR